MINNQEELLKTISTGKLLEHRAQNIELKQNWDQSNGKKISAFANKVLEGPAWLVVGVKDDGGLFGHSEGWAKKTEEKISQHINQHLDPQITCTSLSCHALGEEWIILVEFKNPGAVVYWNNNAYKAAGTTIDIMTPEEAMELTIKLPGLSDFSAQSTISKDLNGKFIKEFGRIISKRREDTPLSTLKDQKENTILERLGIKKSKVSQILFGDFKYRVVFYDKKENPVKNETYFGLFGLLKHSFIEEIQEWSKAQLGITTRPYPTRALKESIANAVAHAAFMESQGDIIIEIHYNKLCISNSCFRESEYFANKWFSKSHKTVNKLLMETLRLAGFVDELGRGKNLIFADSLTYGKQPPYVSIEKGGRYDRWRLMLYGGLKNNTQLRMLNRLKEMYKDDQKALIANALVLWRGDTVSSIRQYVDGESSPLFAEILSDLRGPIFYYKEKDRIILRRWASVLLGEGKDSKQLSAAEEADLQEFARKMQLEYRHGYITPKEFRELAAMGHTKSEQTLSSRLLRKWHEKGVIRKVKRGLYQFKSPKEQVNIKEIISALLAGNEE